MARMGRRGSAYTTLVGKTVGNRPLVRFRRRRDDDINVNLHEAGWGPGLGLFSSEWGHVAGCSQCNDERLILHWAGIDQSV